jgi:hypothetical protein
MNATTPRPLLCYARSGERRSSARTFGSASGLEVEEERDDLGVEHEILGYHVRQRFDAAGLLARQREGVEDVDLALLEGEHLRGPVRHHAQDHAVEVRAARLPVVGVALEHIVAALHRFRELERSGADRLLAELPVDDVLSL